MARITVASLASSLTEVARNLTTAIADLGAQRAKVEVLEARVAELEARCDRLAQRTRAQAPARPAASDERYPFTDKLGRRYRMEGRIRCYAPGH